METFSEQTGMMCEPVGALVVGLLAGLFSVLGYKYLTVIDSPFVSDREFGRGTPYRLLLRYFFKII